MSEPYVPSAREMAGQDEVHLTSGDLSEMLRKAKEQAWDEGWDAFARYDSDQRQSYPDNPYRSGT